MATPGGVMCVARWSACFSIVAVAGCTTAQLSEKPPDGSWQFASDLEMTSQCLVRSLNAEWQPANSAEQIFGRSILHSIINVEPGRTNHVVHEHIGPSTAWMFVVVSLAPKRAAATAHVLHNLAYQSSVEKMERAAVSCGGVRQQA